MQRKQLKLLLTCCLGYYMKETIACFKASDKYDIKIIGLDMNDMDYNINNIDVFYKVPASNSPEYFDVVFDIAKKENVDVVMPLHSKELLPFATKRKMFEDNNMILAVPSIKALEIANDKIESFSHMEKIGLPTPLTFVTDNASEAIAFIDNHADTTFVTKAPDSCGARGFHIVGGQAQKYKNRYPAGVVIEKEELNNIISHGTPYLIQTYLPGMEYTTDLVLKDGLCVAHYTKECPVVEHGIIMRGTTVNRPEVSDLCIKFAESLNLNGNIGFDLKCDENGKPIIIDVNPRITATIGLGWRAGLNLPLIGLDVWLGNDIKECPSATPGISIKRQIADYYFDQNGKII